MTFLFQCCHSGQLQPLVDTSKKHVVALTCGEGTFSKVVTKREGVQMALQNNQ